MSYSTLTHRVGGQGFLQFRTSPLKPWLGWIVSIILAGFAAAFSGIFRWHLVDFSVVFSFKFDFYSEIKCVQSRADNRDEPFDACSRSVQHFTGVRCNLLV